MNPTSVLRSDAQVVRGRRTWREVMFRVPIREALRYGRDVPVTPQECVAGLPEDCASRVLGVVRRARLWHREQTEVASELSSHFREGLATGRTAAQLLEAFGDERRAARLVRRAMRRKRSVAWHLWVLTNRVIVVAILSMAVWLGVLWGRILWDCPTIRTDYVAMARESLSCDVSVPRSYPVIADVAARSEAWMRNNDFYNVPCRNPASADWECAAQWSEALYDDVTRLHAAAKLGTLGNPFDPEMEREYVAAQQRYIAGWQPSKSDADEGLRSVRLSSLGHVRGAARLLVQDAAVARSRGEAARMVADWRALLGLARQCSGVRAPWYQSVALGVYTLLCDDLRVCLTVRPTLLASDELKQFAHELASFGLANRPGNLVPDRVLASWEREDLLQRFFTDDGRGDGRMLSSALSLLDAQAREHTIVTRLTKKVDESAGVWMRASSTAANWQWVLRDESHSGLLDVVDNVGKPANMLGFASRREVAEVWERLERAAAEVAEVPFYARHATALEAISAELQTDDNIRRLAFVRCNATAKSVWAWYDWPVRLAQERDATLAAISCELYRRATGAWPATLEALVPRYLPSVPIDIYDGGPLGYRRTEAGPLIYSVGPDREDDGGRSAEDATLWSQATSDVVYMPYAPVW